MDIKERVFWAKLDKLDGENSCWLWLGLLNKDGYGQLSYKRYRTYAHRLSWELYNKQKIPPNMVVMHTCDNPSCANPHHLKIGTQADNMHDMKEKNKIRKMKVYNQS